MDLVDWFFDLQAKAADYKNREFVLQEVDRVCRERYNNQFFDMPACIRGGLVDYVNGV
jgi:hypothetical protein